jgi:ornithine decarboxylase
MPATFAELPEGAAGGPAGARPDMPRVKSMVLPNPIFEGSEKRVEIDFMASPASPPDGLRALPRDALDELMSLAACTIVSSRTNAHLDAYVLSESSLFVYPTKWVLKTCGTTKLLNAVPRLLEMAAERLSMAPRRCKYSRASFLFPDQQPTPYREGFDQEARFLRTHFGHLGNGGSAYVLGDMFNGLQWHVYVADAHGADAAYCPPSGRPFHKFEVCARARARWQASAGGAPLLACRPGGRALPLPPLSCASPHPWLPSGPGLPCAPPPLMPRPPPHTHIPPRQVCMTDLCREAARAFYRDNPKFVSAKRTTAETGIRDLVPGADIDDFVFEPCGARALERPHRGAPSPAVHSPARSSRAPPRAAAPAPPGAPLPLLTPAPRTPCRPSPACSVQATA